MLFADDYGFHHGDVWYRGRFRGTGAETGINLSRHHRPGRRLPRRGSTACSWAARRTGQARLTFPAGSLRTGADNVLSVLVENMGHNEDYNAADTHKEARGLTGAR